MQVIITQAEIELAIHSYILGQVNVREGMSVTIELMATRGAEGFKAVIDISASDAAPAVRSTNITQLSVVQEEAAPVAPVVQQAAVALKNPVFGQVRAKQLQVEPETDPEADAVETEAEELAAKTTQFKPPHAPVPHTPVPHAPATAPATAAPPAQEEAPKPRPQSLFKGLKKPVNA